MLFSVIVISQLWLDGQTCWLYRRNGRVEGKYFAGDLLWNSTPPTWTTNYKRWLNLAICSSQKSLFYGLFVPARLQDDRFIYRIMFLSTMNMGVKMFHFFWCSIHIWLNLRMSTSPNLWKTRILLDLCVSMSIRPYFHHPPAGYEWNHLWDSVLPYPKRRNKWRRWFRGGRNSQLETVGINKHDLNLRWSVFFLETKGAGFHFGAQKLQDWCLEELLDLQEFGARYQFLMKDAICPHVSSLFFVMVLLRPWNSRSAWKPCSHLPTKNDRKVHNWF